MWGNLSDLSRNLKPVEAWHHKVCKKDAGFQGGDEIDCFQAIARFPNYREALLALKERFYPLPYNVVIIGKHYRYKVFDHSPTL